ncbi:unnamed protein product, partial [Choristocarpus tenellus]
SFTHSGLSEETSCLPFDATANDVDEALEALAGIDTAGVVVTRRGSGSHGRPYVHSVYFEGDKVAGDVNALVVSGINGECPDNSNQPSAPHLFVSTVQEGGRVEQQKLTLATEAGYVLGDYFRLTYSDHSSNPPTSTTECLEWGASADDIAAAISDLPSIADVPLPTNLTLNTTGMDLYPSTEVPISNGSYVNGYLGQGDVIRVDGSYGGADITHKVESVAADGKSITFAAVFRAATGADSVAANVTLILQEQVQSSRSGTGKSVAEVQQLTLTATSVVEPLHGQGFFRLRWRHNGEEAVTQCIEFGASAADIQVAIESLGFDLDDSGGLDEGDEGHIIVSREGDGSSDSGYGYQYKFEFRGLAGVSTVVGNVEQLEVRS